MLRIETQIADTEAKGFAPPDSRFSFDSRVNDHLVFSGLISSEGTLERASGWIRNAWNETRSTKEQATPDTEEDRLLAATVVDSYGSPQTLPKASGAESGADESRQGEVIGQDYLVRDVRKGGMGVVYIVEDLKSRKENVLLRLALKTFQSRYLWNEEAIRRFEREAVVWIELGKHPNIVHAMLVQRVENRPYLWLECVEGESLADLLARKKLEVSEAVNYALQFCRGMRYAHETHNLIHRDIKPANILINRENVLKITDFGLSKLQAQLLEESSDREGVELRADEMETMSGVFVTAAGRCMGTPAYIAPEAILGSQTVDTRADIYSFGIVLYEMLTGRLPFCGANILEQHLAASPVPPRAVDRSVPVDLERIVSRCLQKEASKRFKLLLI